LRGVEATTEATQKIKERTAGQLKSTRPNDHGQMKNPITFIQEVRQEVSKVTWPTWKEVWITTVMVLLMVALTAVFFLIADQIIATVIRFLIGSGPQAG
jgi:preprotein translocase subunit SecE